VDSTLTVVHEDDADHYTVLENVLTQEGAKTMALDGDSHRIYPVSSTFVLAPAGTAADPHPHASIVPGTFDVLVVAQVKPRSAGS
jgi:hypothetical protein